MMDIKILLDTPSVDSLRYLLEEMVDDPYVGTLEPKRRELWIERMEKKIAERQSTDIQSTVAYNGSGIVGIAFSRPLADQSYCANMKEENDFWKMGNFYVLKDYRGQGIGKLALNHFLEAKERKVFYFADRENLASNKVANACGMHYTHDFFVPKWTTRKELCKKGMVVRCPANYFQVYCGVVPPEELIHDHHYMEKNLYENL
jgi:GNAT superfamily N-acetyltransferase